MVCLNFSGFKSTVNATHLHIRVNIYAEWFSINYFVSNMTLRQLDSRVTRVSLLYIHTHIHIFLRVYNIYVFFCYYY